MTELFGNYKRPKAELKAIDKFLKIFQQSKKEYKEKNYQIALVSFLESYELLIDIWDEYPKIICLYYIMKSYFYNKNYLECISVKEKLCEKLSKLSSVKKKETESDMIKKDIFLKMYSKILLFELLINYICDNLDLSIKNILNMISFLTTSKTLSLPQKIKFFGDYLRSFLKITGITKTTKFQLFKQEYDNMLITDPSQSDTEKLQIPRTMIDKYKYFMNSKLRNNLYEILDNEFYFVKFRKINDRVMVFLQKNMHIYVRENNKDKLFEVFNTFLILNKIDLKKEFGMSMRELIHSQKLRIEAFDTIFSNLVGAFSYIFKKYFVNDEENSTHNKNSLSEIKLKKNLMHNLNNFSDILKKFKLLKSNNLLKSYTNMSKKINVEKVKSPENEIIIPSITEDNDMFKSKEKKQNSIKSFNNFFLKKNKDISKENNNYLNTEIKKCYYIKKLNSFMNKNEDNTFKLPNIRNIKSSFKKYKSKSKFNYNDYMFKSRIITDNIRNSFKSFNKSHLIKNNESINEIIIRKEPEFQLRNINNFFLSNLLKLFEYIYKYENNINFKEKTKILNKIFPKRKDLILDYELPQTVKSHFLFNSNISTSFDSVFYFQDFMLIKNFYFFGLFDGHGKNAHSITNKLSILLPSYLIYLLIDNNINEDKEDINKLMSKLIKEKEPPENVKDMHILRYFYNKFSISKDLFNFIYHKNISLFKKIIYEAIYYCNNDLKEIYKLDIDNSGATLCSCFIFGNVLYILNLGDCKIVLGSHNVKLNIWKSKLITKMHIPDVISENKRIIAHKGRIEKYKNEYGEEYGPSRVFDKDPESQTPGIPITRTIGDIASFKLGIIYEPNLEIYEIFSNDKILICGSDGFWKYINEKDAIDFVGKFYENKVPCEEAGKKLIELVKNNKILQKYSNDEIDEETENLGRNKMKKIIVNHNWEVEKLNQYNRREKERNKMYLQGEDITCMIVYLETE